MVNGMAGQSKNDKLKRELCSILTRIGALKFGMFTLSDGRLSPYYIDLRIIPSFPEASERVQNIYKSIIEDDLNMSEIRRIAGIPTAGIPFASVLSYSMKKPFLYIRKEPTRGRERRVEGVLNPGDVVLLVDDLITTGKTMIEAIDSIVSEGGIVKDALVLIDRREGGKKALGSRGVKLHCLTDMSELARILYEMGTIDKEELNSILRQTVS